MPILDVEIVLKPDEGIGPRLAAEIADAAAQVFGAPPQSTWVKVRALPAEHYAENGGDDGPRVFPVFVTLLKARLPSPELRQAEIERLTSLIARLCARPAENVHLIYAPAGAGRVAFGGTAVSE